MHFLGTLENLNNQGCKYSRNVLSKRFKGKCFKCLRDCYIITITHSVVFSSTCNLKLAGIHTVVLGTLISLESVSGKPLPCPCSSFLSNRLRRVLYEHIHTLYRAPLTWSTSGLCFTGPSLKMTKVKMYMKSL